MGEWPGVLVVLLVVILKELDNHWREGRRAGWREGRRAGWREGKVDGRGSGPKC